jgi:hypothetical protein
MEQKYIQIKNNFEENEKKWKNEKEKEINIEK